MNWKVLKTEADYNKAIRMMEIFHAEPGTPESDELDMLIVLIILHSIHPHTPLNHHPNTPSITPFGYPSTSSGESSQGMALFTY